MSDRWLRPATALAAVAGIGVAGYLSWANYADSAVVCVAGGSCEKVQESAYASVVGAPVAVLGLLAYTAILVLIAWDAPGARLSAATIALIALVFSAYLLVVQVFVIDAICTWCLANDALIAPALASLTALRLRSTS